MSTEERPAPAPSSPEAAASADTPAPQRQRQQIEAEYALEQPVRCPTCGETVSKLQAVRLLRSQVNFTSTLPRRGRIMICPACHAIVPAELTNF